MWNNSVTSTNNPTRSLLRSLGLELKIRHLTTRRGCLVVLGPSEVRTSLTGWRGSGDVGQDGITGGQTGRHPEPSVEKYGV